MIEVGSVQVPTTASEMTINQFEKVSACLNDGSVIPAIRYKRALIKLGAIEEELDNLTIVELAQKCKPFNEWRRLEKDKGFTRSFELNGKTYEAYKEGEELKITFKDVEMIEKFLAKNEYKSEKVFCEMIATIFKDNTLTKHEHYAEAHIKHKAKLIRESELSVEPFVNYIVQIVHEIYQAAQVAQITEDGVPK